MNDLKEYYKKHPISNPAYFVFRIAGEHISSRAGECFSGRMIKIGCGDKIKRYLVGEYVENHVGLDHEDTPHNKSNIDLLGSAYKIPQKDASFNCVLSTAVIEHLEDPQRALHEAYRILKPGGYAIYTAPFFWRLHEEPRDFYRYTKYGLEYLFRTAGFEIVELKPLSGFWITFGSELNYYFNDFKLGSIAYIFKFITATNHIVFWFLNKIDKKKHPGTDKWTWMYLVVASKP